MLLPYLAFNEIEFRFRIFCDEEMAFAVLLYRLSTPCRLKALMHIFQRSCAWLCTVFGDVVAHLTRHFHSLLFWDDRRLTYATVAQYARAVEEKSGVRGVWGFIDGTMRAICRPQQNQELYYSGYKKCHAVKYQAVFTPDSLISDLAGPYTGRESDWTVYQDSMIIDKIGQIHEGLDEGGDNRLYIYGDPAYSLSFGILAPYQARPNRPLNNLLANVNVHMSELRISVEHGFGKVMTLWGYNGYKLGLKIGLSPVAAYFMVSVLLCNLYSCLNRNQTCKKFLCDHPSVHNYLAVVLGLP